MFTGFSPAVRFVARLFASQAQPTKFVLVEMLAGCEEVTDCLGLSRSCWCAVNVGVGYPDGLKSSAGGPCVEVDFPAGASPVRFVETSQLLSDRTFEQVAEITKAV